jgi:hypothetical protein
MTNWCRRNGWDKSLYGRVVASKEQPGLCVGTDVAELPRDRGNRLQALGESRRGALRAFRPRLRSGDLSAQAIDLTGQALDRDLLAPRTRECRAAEKGRHNRTRPARSSQTAPRAEDA